MGKKKKEANLKKTMGKRKKRQPERSQKTFDL